MVEGFHVGKVAIWDFVEGNETLTVFLLWETSLPEELRLNSVDSFLNRVEDRKLFDAVVPGIEMDEQLNDASGWLIEEDSWNYLYVILLLVDGSMSKFLNDIVTFKIFKFQVGSFVEGVHLVLNLGSMQQFLYFFYFRFDDDGFFFVKR